MRIRSSAAARPMRRGRRCVPPAPGMRPSITSGRPSDGLRDRRWRRGSGRPAPSPGRRPGRSRGWPPPPGTRSAARRSRMAWPVARQRLALERAADGREVLDVGAGDEVVGLAAAQHHARARRCAPRCSARSASNSSIIAAAQRVDLLARHVEGDDQDAVRRPAPGGARVARRAASVAALMPPLPPRAASRSRRALKPGLRQHLVGVLAQARAPARRTAAGVLGEADGEATVRSVRPRRRLVDQRARRACGVEQRLVRRRAPAPRRRRRAASVAHPVVAVARGEDARPRRAIVPRARAPRCPLPADQVGAGPAPGTAPPRTSAPARPPPGRGRRGSGRRCSRR